MRGCGNLNKENGARYHTQASPPYVGHPNRRIDPTISATKLEKPTNCLPKRCSIEIARSLQRFAELSTSSAPCGNTCMVIAPPDRAASLEELLAEWEDTVGSSGVLVVYHTNTIHTKTAMICYGFLYGKAILYTPPHPSMSETL